MSNQNANQTKNTPATAGAKASTGAPAAALPAPSPSTPVAAPAAVAAPVTKKVMTSIPIHEEDKAYIVSLARSTGLTQKDLLRHALNGFKDSQKLKDIVKVMNDTKAVVAAPAPVATV